MLLNLIKELQGAKNLEQAKLLQRFFKTGKGEYGEGDVFLGLKVPVTREIAKRYNGLNLKSIELLLKSKVHEYRLAALLILVEKFKNGGTREKAEIFNFYIKNTERVNNWDLVDLTSHKIVGEFLKDKKRDKLYELSQSQNLWERRISIISCFAFIKDQDFKDALKISEILLKDAHDLIHKAVGWALREIGKKDIEELEKFLEKNYKEMPRTMLRYSIEKLSEEKRKAYLGGNV
ncbi:MAG TPA: DNA alkylation repair protein [Candidatus Nanoarchaeia archaeon]|nr:DNA alkylation repair protein [Candidatus Nanoarchaeia archaeon]